MTVPWERGPSETAVILGLAGEALTLLPFFVDVKNSLKSYYFLRQRSWSLVSVYFNYFPTA